jgi:hypothetical protein
LCRAGTRCLALFGRGHGALGRLFASGLSANITGAARLPSRKKPRFTRSNTD